MAHLMPAGMLSQLTLNSSAHDGLQVSVHGDESDCSPVFAVSLCLSFSLAVNEGAESIPDSSETAE